VKTGGFRVKTAALVLLFGVVGFFVGVLLVHLMFQWGGMMWALIGMVFAIPLATAAGVVVGFRIAQRQ
jgi:hypothetical protein